MASSERVEPRRYFWSSRSASDAGFTGRAAAGQCVRARHAGRGLSAGRSYAADDQPGGRKDDYGPAADDVALYDAYRAFARTGSQASFSEASGLFAKQMRAWRIYTQRVAPILHAARTSIERIAYAYVAPFRVRDDSAALIKESAQRAAYDAGLGALLDALDPGLLICLDRVSEGCALRHVAGRPGCRVKYYTRKRDAHQQRRETLREIAVSDEAEARWDVKAARDAKTDRV